MKNNSIDFIVKCIHCQKKHTIEITADDYTKHLNGMHVHDAFPYLNEDQIQLIAHNICPTCLQKEIDDDNYCHYCTKAECDNCIF